MTQRDMADPISIARMFLFTDLGLARLISFGWQGICPTLPSLDFKQNQDRGKCTVAVIILLTQSLDKPRESF